MAIYNGFGLIEIDEAELTKHVMPTSNGKT